MDAIGVRWATVIPGLICLFLGALWTLQGAGVVGGSFMTRQTIWIVVGVPLALIGLYLMYRGLPRRKTQS